MRIDDVAELLLSRGTRKMKGIHCVHCVSTVCPLCVHCVIQMIKKTDRDSFSI